MEAKMTVQTKRSFLGWAAVGMAMLMAIGVGGCANAYGPPDLVGLSVVDRDTGQPLRVWRHNGRMFVAGRPGARYALRVSNHTGNRVMVVLSVDGVNILTGETAGYDQRGYVFDPYEEYDLNGWRKSDSEVAAFTFAPLPESYAARTGRPGDVGVIGMAVFRERAPVRDVYPEAPAHRWRAPDSSGRGGLDLQRPSPAPPPAEAPATRSAPSSGANAAAEDQAPGDMARREDERLGTGHGEREWSVVTTVDFVRATSYPQSIRRIEYNTYANLVAAGVIPARPYAEHRPQPFPGNPGGYVPDPPPGPDGYDD